MTGDSVKTAALESLRMNRRVVCVILAYILSVLIAGRVMGFEVDLTLYNFIWVFSCFATFFVVMIPFILFQFFRHRPERPLLFSWRLLSRMVQRGIVALPCLVLLPAFLSAFTSIKTAIPVLQAYRLDPLFARLDSMLHGGHAWELIHPIVGFPAVTSALNIAYLAWFLLGWIALISVTFMAGNRELREQYLLAFCGSWILIGTVAAIAMASVGPCFYGLLYPGEDLYAPLMDYLRSANEIYPITALSTQELIWDMFAAGTMDVGTGVSAMPSMHVAKATLNAILLSKLSRTAGILGWIYVAVTVVGSVHLGWHYAIDGYVAIVGVLVIWRAAGWWVARSASPAPVTVGSA